MYRHQNYFDTMCSYWDIDENKTRFSVMAALICLFSTKYWCNLFWNGLIWFFTPQNMGIDTNIILIPCIVTEILTKTRFSVMAALICILCGLPKDDRVASFRFLKSTPQRYRNSKKTLYGANMVLENNTPQYMALSNSFSIWCSHMPIRQIP